MLNQRLMDMKKTLQHELKSNSTDKITTHGTGNGGGGNSSITTTTATSTSSSSTTTTNSLTNKINNTSRTKPKSCHTADSNGLHENEIDQTTQSNDNTHFVMDDVNFKYLKHVILKFLTSREVRESHREIIPNFVKIF